MAPVAGMSTFRLLRFSLGSTVFLCVIFIIFLRFPLLSFFIIAIFFKFFIFMS